MNENATYERKERPWAKLQTLAEELPGELPRSTPSELAAIALALLIGLTRGGLGGGA